MPHFFSSITFIFCQLTFLLHSTSAIKHQMFCESVDGTFDNEIPNPIIERHEIEAMIESRIIAETTMLLNRIRVLERQVEELNTTLVRTNEAGECDDGFEHHGTCYFAIIPERVNLYGIPFPQRNNTCHAKGGRLGNILSSEHQTLVENYVRYKIPFTMTKAWIWLGMTYNPTAKTVVTSDGKEIADSKYRWYRDYPRTIENTYVLMQVEKDNSEAGIYNIATSDGSARATSVLVDRIKVLEEQVQDLNSTLARQNGVGPCDDGFLHLGICYFAIIPHPETIPFTERNNTCIAKGARLGNILGSEHQTLVENYLRQKIPFSLTQAWIWLGMTYNPVAKTVVTSDGKEIADSKYRWYSNYPKSLDGTNVLIQVAKDYSEAGVYNIRTDNAARAIGAFCEK